MTKRSLFRSRTVTGLGVAASAAVLVLAMSSAEAAVPPPPAIGDDGLRVDFGRVLVGTVAYGATNVSFPGTDIGDGNVIFTNQSPTYTVEDFTVESHASHPFTGNAFILNCDHVDLAPGQSCEVDFTFSPTSTGDVEGLDPLDITYKWTYKEVPQPTEHLVRQVSLHGYGSLLCRRHLSTITGTPGDDVLLGTPGDDVIAGGGGSDIIRGNGGNDIICGGPGADRLFGGQGVDRLFGGLGRDLCKGGAGRDRGRFCEIRKSL